MLLEMAEEEEPMVHGPLEFLVGEELNQFMENILCLPREKNEKWCCFQLSITTCPDGASSPRALFDLFDAHSQGENNFTSY